MVNIIFAVQFYVPQAPLPNQGVVIEQKSEKNRMSTKKNFERVVLLVSCWKLLMISAKAEWLNVLFVCFLILCEVSPYYVCKLVWIVFTVHVYCQIMATRSNSEK